MRTIITSGLAAVALVLALPAMAQAPAPASPPKIFTSAADVAAMIAKAKATVAADPRQTNMVQGLLSLDPYRPNLEYRTGHAPAAIHPTEAEMFYVIDGAGVLVTGGRLVMPSSASRAGAVPEIEGGESRRIVKGDAFFVPQNTPHQITSVEGALVLMSVHVPRS